MNRKAMMSADATIRQALLAVHDLVVEFSLGRRSKIQAVSGVSLQIQRGETLGLVGESGCGKSTLARSIVGLLEPSRGEIRFDSQEITAAKVRRRRKIRRNIQMIFQDAAASLNPGRGVGKSIAEPLRVRGGTTAKARTHLARRLMEEVGLDPDQDFHKRPFEFSGGQCQRISIARALIAKPQLLICDEPVSSLDVSVQAQILNLLEDIKVHHGLTLFFISHDLAVVKNICDRVAVMYLGKLCEVADSESLFQTPRHPYTAALLAAVPKPETHQGIFSTDSLASVELPSPAAPPSGCRFHTRCPKTRERCVEKEPEWVKTTSGRQLACHFPLD